MDYSGHIPSLVTRLIKGALLWTVPIWIIAAMLLTWFYRTSTFQLFDDPLENAITDLIAAVNVTKDENGTTKLELSREPIDPRYQRALSGRYWMIGEFDQNGAIVPLQASRSLSDETLELPTAIKRSIDNKIEVKFITNSIGPDQEPLRILAQWVMFPNVNGVIILAGADRRELQGAVQRFALLAIGLMLLLSAAMVFAIHWQVRLGLGPLFNLRDSVVDVREGRRDRVDGVYPDEIAPLATELNRLINHNKDVVKRARTHVSNLAHGLKTPLAVMLNEADSRSSVPSEIISRQATNMKQQVNHHLRRAQAAARGQVIGVSSPVEDVILSLVRTLERINREKDIQFDLNIAKNLIFRGEKRDLEEMAGNLMDNACKWTHSKVKVTANLVDTDETLFLLKVADNGPGLNEDEYKLALKRGARLDEKTPGTGFGLAIVDDLAQAYKGELTLARSDMGGLEAILMLPGRNDG